MSIEVSFPIETIKTNLQHPPKKGEESNCDSMKLNCFFLVKSSHDVFGAGLAMTQDTDVITVMLSTSNENLRLQPGHPTNINPPLIPHKSILF